MFYINLVLKSSNFPSKDHFIINIREYTPEWMLLILNDMRGQKMQTKRLYEGSNSIDLKKLKAGIYLLEIVEKGRLIKMDKLIKM
ncbi:MAG: T9SS type A sorting domain-containing protein [Bacteroidota bacterium]|nr:T9SS type A sorting domain-containing protein [Bacteroidota bacterium]